MTDRTDITIPAEHVEMFRRHAGGNTENMTTEVRERVGWKQGGSAPQAEVDEELERLHGALTLDERPCGPAGDLTVPVDDHAISALIECLDEASDVLGCEGEALRPDYQQAWGALAAYATFLRLREQAEAEEASTRSWPRRRTRSSYSGRSGRTSPSRSSCRPRRAPTGRRRRPSASHRNRALRTRNSGSCQAGLAVRSSRMR